MSGAGEDEYMLRTAALRKVYPAQGAAPAKVAVESLSMNIRDGQCFGFLGPNGAGKTTTISMVTGLFQPTSGTAYVNGLDIRTSMDDIHMNMGVCPQDNILWGDLTGPEHLRFYGRIKNLSGSALTAAVDEGLASVNLGDPATRKKLVSEYSGGMQRRLSVAISLMGDPKLVILDEPSTGLDPASRRALWDIILYHKTRCAMILTTHAMEEADALCDRLAIFQDGRVRCSGTPNLLKFQFGKGFKISVTADPDLLDDMEAWLLTLCPNAERLNTISGTRNYETPKEGLDLATIFRAFKDRKDDFGIKVGWGGVWVGGGGGGVFFFFFFFLVSC